MISISSVSSQWLRNILSRILGIFGQDRNFLKLFSSLQFTCESVEEATFAFIFSAIDEKNVLKPSAISRLSVTMFPSMTNDALMFAFDLPRSSLISFHVFLMLPAAMLNLLL